MSRRLFARGEIVNIELEDPDDPSAKGPIRKYVVVLQGGAYWDASSRLLAALITSQPQTRLWPHLVVIEPYESRLRERSYIDCGDVHRLRRSVLEAGNTVHTLGPDVMERVNRALVVGVGTITPDV
jgi:hypothetical protein